MEPLAGGQGALLRSGETCAPMRRHWPLTRARRTLALKALVVGVLAAALAGALSASAWASTSPTVTTGTVSSITETSATLNATVTPNGELSECKFEYGTTNAYGSSAKCTPNPGSGSSPVAVSATISGLEQTSYHYRIVAANAHGRSYGSEETFSTVLAHWYRDEKELRRNKRFSVKTEGTLTLHRATDEITCKIKDEDTIENPADGAAGTDSLTAELVGCKATSSPCPKGEKASVDAHGLPWSSQLLAGPPVRDEISNIELRLECTSKGGSAVVIDTLTGTLAPEVGQGVLRFSGAGELQEGHNEVIVTGEDLLKSSKNRAISAKAAERTFVYGGEAVAWGRNIAEQLGVGFKTSSGGGEESPDRVLGLAGIEQIASGLGGSELGFALALMHNGTVQSWGANEFGELGRGELASEEEELIHRHCTLIEPPEGGEGEESEEGVEAGTSEKAPVDGLSEMSAVAAAGAHDLALSSSGTVYAWGTNEDGEHGDKKGGQRCQTGEPNSLPKPVEGLSEVEAIAAGGASDFALVKQGAASHAGEVLAWGRDIEGKLGVGHPSTSQRKREREQWERESAEKENGERETIAESEWECHTEVGTDLCSKEPRPVVKLPAEIEEQGETAHITAISAGASFALALYSNGTVRAWGGNGSSELGSGGSEGKIYETPVKVKGLGEGTELGPAVAISAGAGEPGHALALLADGKVVGWGNDRLGELGPTGETCRDSAPCIKTPKLIAGLEDIAQVSAGEAYSLALSQSGVIYSLGYNKFGQLGTGSTAEQSEVPTAITGVGAVGAISAGEHSAYAILDSGVAAPPPLMAIIPGPESLEATWTFAASSAEKGFHVCYHLAVPHPKCPFEAFKIPATQQYISFGELTAEPYFVSVFNGEKTRAIKGTPLP